MNSFSAIFKHETVKQIVYSPEVRPYIFSCAEIMIRLNSFSKPILDLVSYEDRRALHTCILCLYYTCHFQLYKH